jgi:carnitine O-acetyltransferase
MSANANDTGKKRTYAGQQDLPRLPIPSLEDTLERFTTTVSTLLSSEEKEACKKEVNKFLSTDGPLLQKLLVEYDERGRDVGTLGSFVEEFWSDSYLAPDSSVVMNLNPFFVLEDGPDNKKSKDQGRIAASLAFSAIKFASSLKKETIIPDEFRGKPLCMDQFRALFGACRVPKINERDTVEVDPESSHVAVLQNNQMYFFQALGSDGTVCVNEQDILEILAAIKTDATQLPPDITSRNSLGVLTTLPRKEWAAARNLLISTSQHNETALEVIDGALFVLVIDDVEPKDIHEAAANMLHGTYDLRSRDNLIDYQAGSCCNRWYDKLQLIVCSDGRAGINFEHSAIDGHTALRFVSDIFADNVVSFAQSITQTIYSGEIFPSIIQAEVKRSSAYGVIPKKLNFELPQKILDKIYYAETALSDQIVASETYVLEFTGYGKTLIVRNNIR